MQSEIEHFSLLILYFWRFYISIEIVKKRFYPSTCLLHFFFVAELEFPVPSPKFQKS